jgi:hypothetical protein
MFDLRSNLPKKKENRMSESNNPAATSGANIPPADASPSQSYAARVMEWSRPTIAIFGLIIFAVAFGLAWTQISTQLGQATFNTLVGAVVALVSTISGYYFGSSVGSQKKDDAIQSALATAQGAQPSVK